jgi:hypothetical protein
VNQFLASGNIDGTFKKLVGAFVKASFYQCVIGAADDVAGRMRMLTRARLLHWLIVLTSPLSLSSQPLPASRLLLPRSGLERSDFVPWPIAAEIDVPWNVSDQGRSGLVVLNVRLSHFDPKATLRLMPFDSASRR